MNKSTTKEEKLQRVEEVMNDVKKKNYFNLKIKKNKLKFFIKAKS